MPRLSGLQIEVLQLYRQFFRTVRRKQMGTAGYKLVRDSFRSKQQYPKRDVQAIENWIRTGRTKLESLQQSNTKISFINVQMPRKAK